MSADTRKRARFTPPPDAPRRRGALPVRGARRPARVTVQLAAEPAPVILGATQPGAAAQRQRLLLLLGLLAIAGCAREDVVHAVDEAQANAVLVALDGRGIAARLRGDDAREGGWVVSVPSRDAAAARRALADDDLPHARAPGLGEVFGKPGMVPTPLEERARYLHALSGELARSIETIDAIAEARVHLALAPEDPLRTQAPPPPRAAVLVKVRPGLRARVDPMVDGIRSLVAGSVAGLDAATVSVVVSEALTPAGPRLPEPRRRNPLLLAVAAIAAALAAGVVAWPLHGRAMAALARAVAARRDTP